MRFIHETFFVYKLETFTNFKEVKHIMIMIIAIISIFFLSYEVFDQQLKIIFRKSSCLPEKIHPHLFTPPPLKIQSLFLPLCKKEPKIRQFTFFISVFFRNRAKCMFPVWEFFLSYGLIFSPPVRSQDFYCKKSQEIELLNGVFL